MVPAVRSAPAASLSTATTFAPRAAKASAAARPIPLLAPVMSATLPLNCMGFLREAVWRDLPPPKVARYADLPSGLSRTGYYERSSCEPDVARVALASTTAAVEAPDLRCCAALRFSTPRSAWGWYAASAGVGPSPGHAPGHDALTDVPYTSAARTITRGWKWRRTRRGC